MSEPLRNMGVADIIKASMQNRPVDVETAFNNAIQDKMMAAIDARREEITANLYADADDSVEDIDDDIDVEDTAYAEEEIETETEEEPDEDF